MSSYVEVKTEFKDLECLETALREAGFVAVQHARGPEPIRVEGYNGGSRFGHVVVPKGTHDATRWEGMAFERQADGNVKAHVSSHMKSDVMDRIRQRYARAVVVKQGRAKGYAVAGEKVVGGKVQFVLRKF